MSEKTAWAIFMTMAAILFGLIMWAAIESTKKPVDVQYDGVMIYIPGQFIDELLGNWYKTATNNNTQVEN